TLYGVPRTTHSFPTRRSSDLRAHGGGVPLGRLRSGNVVQTVPVARAHQPSGRDGVSGRVVVDAAEVIPVVTFSLAISPVSSPFRSEEHTSELQSRENLVCRLL